MTTSYNLLDSGNGRKLEKFGPYILARPCSQAVWQPYLSQQEWHKAHASFSREKAYEWNRQGSLPETWTIDIAEITFKLSMTDFGHLGIFPEQKEFWQWIQTFLKESRQKRGRPPKVLNLFAYSGGSTLAAAKAGAAVCHLDASKGMVAWARENASLNELDKAPIRWIIDDVKKFLSREIRRGASYDAIILDPPTFGRGAKGELFKIEEDLIPLLQACNQLLSDDPLFVILSCHTPGFTPLVMHHVMAQTMKSRKGLIDVGEMVLSGQEQVLPVPSGTFARWMA
jgi:23S rRNA (cytosine1962-C5)-methyltransferase